MDPAIDDPGRFSPLDDPEAWSGSDDPEGPYCSQDEAYYGETESDPEPQSEQESSNALDHLLDPKPENPESSFSDYSQEDDAPGLLCQSPDPCLDTLSDAQNDNPPEDQDPKNLDSSPLSISNYSAHNQEDHQPSASGSSSPDQAITLPQPRKQLAQESLDSLESEEEEKQSRGGGGKGGGKEAAPPALYVTDGIQAHGAEQAVQWGAASLTETTKASRQRTRHECLRRSEGQSEKHLKEAKSKCKRIAQLLTAAPNPESKGVLMFKKRRQRARKFTLVSYGTRKPEDDSFEDEYGFEDDNIGKDFRFSLPATSESEFDEDFCFNVQGQGAALNVFYNYEPQEERTLTNYNWEKMEQLPHTKGKGVLMFAQRRQRIDEITAQHEEMRQKGIPVEAFVESETVAPSMPTLREENVPVHQDVHVKQQPQYQEQQYQQQMYQQPNTGVNGLDPYQVSSMSKSLVSNRTAKPFGGLNHAPIPYSPVRGVPNPTPKKSENIFKVPIPVNTSPQVWSPTGDIIASRDERIAVPAIKTGILPEAKRRANKADSRHVPPEEDYLSLGAEACNFMQAPTVRQKHPPPVLPKPAINPACPPWSAEGHAPRSPLPASSPVPAQQNWAPPQPQPATKPWAPSPTQPLPQQHMPAWVPHNPSASYQAAWASEPQQAPVSIKTPTTPHAAPSQSRTPWTKPQIDANSVASCPPQQGSSYFHASKAPPASPRGHASETGLSDGPTLKGKGAELFARRQSRMEKFVVDAKTVQANRANRPPSPTLSMPSTWKYSPNIRAPPPVSYNPIVSPFYPLAAQKQPTSVTSPKPQANKEKPKPPPKHLSVVDVMKHQPYQLDTSLFTYSSFPEVKGASPKTSPVPPPESKQTFAQTPSHLQPPSSGHFLSPTLSPSPVPTSGSAQSFKQGAPVKPSGPVYSRSRSMSLPRRHSSVSTLSPVSSPCFHPTRGPLDRQVSWVEQPQKPPSPWEAAARSPLGLVDDAFGPQNVQQAISASINTAAHRKSLPEPPLEWKRRVSNDPIEPPQVTTSTLAATSPTKAFAPASEKAIVYGPPFRPAQPLTIGIRYTGTSSLPRNFSLHTSYAPTHRVSWKM
ncbi:synaptopodin-2 isoform X1 [Pygocentrus nattereri]|uniref:Synaptopodin 2b n=1 Tax=Pygocentrus nattereri TaxID=42514 RepID=A0AAR2KN26_PYGNA|nr:synaptopodin-2 isoform X1 [Pygocentrus nattereri]